MTWALLFAAGILGGLTGSVAGLASVATYPALLSLAGAKEKLAFHIDAAKRHLQQADVDGATLAYICELVAVRDH